jgi:hypothetical protein
MCYMTTRSSEGKFAFLLTARIMGAWKGVAMDSLKFHTSLPCPTFLSHVGGPPLKRPHGCFRDGPPTRRAACGRLLPFGHPTLYAYVENEGGNDCQSLGLILMELVTNGVCYLPRKTNKSAVSGQRGGDVCGGNQSNLFLHRRISRGGHGLPKV